jgi:HAD superfamily hydrolase (TIGR01490 family)
MSLAIFDLDNTLIGGDSDHLWGEFLVAEGIVDRTQYEAANQQFYDDYKAGQLDIVAFLNFSLKPLSLHPTEKLFAWREQFIEEVVKPVMLPAASKLVEKHRSQGDTLLVITATNRFVTAPIVKLLGIDNLLATTPEMVDGRYTGGFNDTPCYREGKVVQLNQWLSNSRETLQGSYFYSDSFNDLPLLKLVDNPIAVDPDEILRKEAEIRHWPIISLRDAG